MTNIRPHARMKVYDDNLREQYGDLLLGCDDSGRGCETSDAEILTHRGWINCYEIKNHDRVLSRTADGCLVWQNIQSIVLKPHIGDIITMSNSDGLIVKVTKDHCFDVLKRISKNKKTVGFKQEYLHVDAIKSNDFLPRTGRWTGKIQNSYTIMPTPRIKHDTKSQQIEKDIIMDNWLAFLGIYLSEGCCVKANKGCYKIKIAAFKPKIKDDIGVMLGYLPFNFITTPQGYECYDKVLWLELQNLGNVYTKKIPQYIKDLPSEQLQIFLRWFMIGDGNIYQPSDNRKPFRTIYTSSTQLRDGLEEIILKLGMSYTTSSKPAGSGKGIIKGRKIISTVPNYRIVIKYSKHTIFQNLQKTITHYEGDVFCLRLEKCHNFCVRRNGHAYFTGNSWAGPLAIGAVILPKDCEIIGLNDSKKLNEEARIKLTEEIKKVAIAWSVKFVHAPEIDAKGITWANTQATKQACIDCFKQIHKPTVDIFVADNTIYFPYKPAIVIPKGDSTSLSVAAASVLAKTIRDAFMVELAQEHPEYGWAESKGYINDIHKDAVRKHGMVKGIHRESYKISGFNRPHQITLLDL